jgi:endonuclease YncB( thermonuclease family)
MEAVTVPSDVYVRKVKLKRVIDGDTLRLTVDLGFNCFQDQSFRVSGVVAKELSRGTDEDKKKGRDCRQYVIAWFERHRTLCSTAAQWPFIVVPEKSDSFGRFLATVYCLKGHKLNDDILSSGLAEAYRRREQ